MLKITASATLVLIVSWLACSAALADQWVAPVDITGHVPKEVRAIDGLIGSISGKVAECRAAGRDSTQCMCAQSDLHRRLQKLADQVLAGHPEWKGGAVKFREAGGERMVSFAGLDMQFQFFERACR